MCGGGGTFDGVESNVLYRMWIALFVELRAVGSSFDSRFNIFESALFLLLHAYCNNLN